MKSVRAILRVGLLLLGFSLPGMGCSGGGSGSSGVQISPKQIANQALADYDTDKNGGLDAKELEQCPALKAALKRIDKDNDGRVTSDELVQRLTYFQREGPEMATTAEVTFDGEPLAGASITFVPEKFLGPTFKTARAVTNAAGAAQLKLEGTDSMAIPLGYYRVEVSKKNAQGKELLPARYNAKTILGEEVTPDSQGSRGAGGTLVLNLKSR
jgi:hypothetical protein